jgi:hypothetical protein
MADNLFRGRIPSWIQDSGVTCRKKERVTVDGTTGLVDTAYQTINLATSCRNDTLSEAG